MYNLEKIELLPARERVASELRKSIIAGNIESGTVLTLEDTAKSLGVSTTPVREAFQILQGEGLIDLAHNRGAVVIGMTTKDIEDHYELRAILESAAAKLASQNRDSLDELKSIYETSVEARKNKDVQTYSDLNQSFHFAIWRASLNQKLVDTLSSLWNGLSVADRLKEEAYIDISSTEHEKILKAIIDGDGTLAYDLMYAHILRSKDSMLK